MIKMSVADEQALLVMDRVPVAGIVADRCMILEAARYRIREAARRIGQSEKNAREGPSAFLAWIPGFEQRGNSALPRSRERPPFGQP